MRPGILESAFPASPVPLFLLCVARMRANPKPLICVLEPNSRMGDGRGQGQKHRPRFCIGPESPPCKNGPSIIASRMRAEHSPVSSRRKATDNHAHGTNMPTACHADWRRNHIIEGRAGIVHTDVQRGLRLKVRSTSNTPHLTLKVVKIAHFV
jgi:hypothetical protein